MIDAYDHYRAQRLREGAQKIVSNHNGEIPSSISTLMEIPGIGPYTAGAISSIAFNVPEALVDGNVIRVLTRLRAVKSEISPSVDKQLWSLARALVDPIDPGSFNQVKHPFTLHIRTASNSLHN